MASLKQGGYSEAPLVSIVTPLYNKGPFIKETAASVLSQTCTQWEWLVVDNGSTDCGPEIVAAIDNPRVSLLLSEKRGPCVARNLGVKQARGEWILFLDADDLLAATFLERYLDSAREHPAAEIVVGSCYQFLDGQQDKGKLMKPTGQAGLLDSAVAFAPWPICAAILRRSVLTEGYLWPEALDDLPFEDTAFWFRLLTRCTVAYTDEACAFYRFQTPECRHTLKDISRRFEGIHAAVTMNIACLRGSGKEVTAGQCEALMREYSEMFLIARSQKEVGLADRALTEAKYWLKTRVRGGGAMSVPMRVRSWMGLRLFLELRRRLDYLILLAGCSNL
jgi:glycosyltransferase involved in cell wall biosynthesis